MLWLSHTQVPYKLRKWIDKSEKCQKKNEKSLKCQLYHRVTCETEQADFIEFFNWDPSKKNASRGSAVRSETGWGIAGVLWTYPYPNGKCIYFTSRFNIHHTAHYYSEPQWKDILLHCSSGTTTMTFSGASLPVECGMKYCAVDIEPTSIV